MIRLAKIAPMLALSLTVLTASTRDAGAAYVPSLVSTTSNGDGTFTWTYNVIWGTAGAPSLSIITGNGTVSPGTTGSQDFITFYDIQGYVTGSATAGGSHTLFTPLVTVGSTGPNTSPTDSPDVVNLTYRFTGGTQTADATFTGFSFRSTVGTANPQGFYSSQFTNTSLAGTKVGEVGRMALPNAIPEPASLALVGLGLAGVGLVARRRHA